MKKWLAAAWLLFSFTNSPIWAQTLWGAVGAGAPTSGLLVLDPFSGNVSRTVGDIRYPVTGLAIHPTSGVLYGSIARTNPIRGLLQINKTTGVGTLIGTYNVNGGEETMTDLAFTPDGTLYGWGSISGNLHVINLNNGAATPVGDSGVGAAEGGGLESDSRGTLYGTIRGPGGRLYTVDRTTGLATVVAVLTGPPSLGSNYFLSALSFNGVGTLYGVALPAGVRTPSRLVNVNPISGAITVLGNAPPQLDAIAFDLVTGAPFLDEHAFLVLAMLLGVTGFFLLRLRS